MTQAVIEAFFVGWTVLGLLVSVVNLWSVVRNRRRVLRRVVTDAQRFILLDDIRREVLRVLAHLSLVAPALVAAATPDRVGPVPARTLVQLVVLWGLLLTPVLLAVSSIMDALARSKLRKFYHDR